MNLLYVTRPIVPPWNEGSKNLTWQLAARFKRHTACLLTTKAAETHDTNHIHWHRIYSENKLTIKQKFRLVGSLAIKPPSVDLFHFYFVPNQWSSAIWSAITRFHNKKSVQTIPCLPAKLPPPEKIRKLIFADQVVVYSRYTEHKLRDWGLNNITRIEVGIDVARFAQARPDPYLRHRLGLDETDVLILFAGEYARLGSTTTLKQIIPSLTAQFPHCHFLIACRILLSADLNIRADLQQFVQDQQLARQVHFVDEVSDFAALLKSSDIFLFPVTDMQGKIDTPLTLIEAMAAGLPVITQDVPPLDEIFGRNNLSLVTNGDIAGMVNRLQRLITDASLRQQEGANNLSIVRQRYNLDNMVRAYEKLYDSLS